MDVCLIVNKIYLYKDCLSYLLKWRQIVTCALTLILSVLKVISIRRQNSVFIYCTAFFSQPSWLSTADHSKSITTM